MNLWGVKYIVTIENGFPEFVDAWRQPIRFLRWAPGFVSDLQATLTLTVDSTSNPSPGVTQIVTRPSARLEIKPGSYLGGAVILEDSANAGAYRATTMAKITGYAFTPATPPTNPGTATFLVASPPAFSLSPGDVFFVTAPDPFDPTGVYPTVAQPTPSFALYPLIYSAGPDKCYGVVSDNATAVRYSTQGMNPFTVSTGANQELIGNTRDIPTEPNFVSRGWIDNIHNHLITTR